MLEKGPSQHLSWAELACHNSFGKQLAPYPPERIDRALALASEFEALREACTAALGKAAKIRVISAYRTPERNAAVGGASGSMHVEGRALDLAPPRGMTYDEFVGVVLDQASRRGIIRGVGIYRADGHVHVDIRPAVKLARWGK